MIIFPPSVHSSGRYLIDANKVPIFIHGDTAWSVSKGDQAGVLTYLNNRVSLGFNAIIVELIEIDFGNGTNARADGLGNLPFTSQGNYSTINQAYFDQQK